MEVAMVVMPVTLWYGRASDEQIDANDRIRATASHDLRRFSGLIRQAVPEADIVLLRQT